MSLLLSLLLFIYRACLRVMSYAHALHGKFSNRTLDCLLKKTCNRKEWKEKGKREGNIDKEREGQRKGEPWDSLFSARRNI